MKPRDDSGSNCPKAIWVMTVLSDDEALERPGVVPPGLSFHLSRCDSCKALADGLLKVSRELRAMSEAGPSERLFANANVQVLAALREGANLTGRVAIPEELDGLETGIAGLLVGSNRTEWYRYARYAAAAVILIAVGLAGFTRLYGPEGPKVAEKLEPAVSEPPSPSIAPDPADGVPDEIQLEERLAVVSQPHDESAIEPTEQGRRTPRACRHRSHVEAAMCEKAHCIRRAIILPGRRLTTLANQPAGGHASDVGWVWSALGGFDSPPATDSTIPRRKDRQ